MDKAEKLALVFKTCELDDAGIAMIYYFESDDDVDPRHLEL